MWHVAGATGAIGLEIAAAIAVGYLGGEYLDRKLGTAPWLGWLGLVCGTGAAIKALIRVTRQYKKSLREEDESSPGPKDV